MIKNFAYRHTDGIDYQVIYQADETPDRYIPTGYEPDQDGIRTVGYGQCVEAGRYTSSKTGETVHVIVFESRYDIDGVEGYTIMTTNPLAEGYTHEQQDELIKCIHNYKREQMNKEMIAMGFKPF